MIIILKPLFEILTGDIVIFDNIIYNYIALLGVGEIAYRIAYQLVGCLYDEGIIDGKSIGSIIHWGLRVIAYLGTAYLIKIIICIYKLLTGIPMGVWGCLIGTVIMIQIYKLMIEHDGKVSAHQIRK